MTLYLEDLLQLLLAIVVGGMIGVERELRQKAAGFRTNIFICVGATFFTIVAEKYTTPSDTARIVANIVSGVGFLGAGVIMREGGRVTGLTTAAVIWLAAALGMGIGSEQYLLVGAMSIAAMIILWTFPLFESRIDRWNERRSYVVVCPSQDKLGQMDGWLRECGLRARSRKRAKRDGQLVCTWDTWGPDASHDKFTGYLVADAEIQEFDFERNT